MKEYRHIVLIINEAEERQRQVRRGIYAAARPLYPWGFHCLSPDHLASSPHTLKEADGWIGFPTPEQVEQAPAAYHSIPHVWLNAAENGSHGTPQIDFTSVGRENAVYFRKKGYRHFALVFSRNSRRREALENGIREGGVRDLRQFPGYPLEPGPDLPAGVRADFHLDLYRFLAQLPDPSAVITEDAERGLEVIEICRRTGIAVPARLAVLSAEDGSRAEMAFPPCSAFQLPWRQLGRHAAQSLARRFRSAAPQPESVDLGPVKLHERGSTDMLAVSDPVIRTALQIIREEACEGLTVHDLLTRVHRPRRWLERRFKVATGSTVLREIHRIRLQKAKELLLETDLTQDCIAEACGFNSLPRFVAAFQKQENRVPGSFRKELRT